MKIRVKGEMSMPALRQALFEQLYALEEDHFVRHCREVSLFLTPTNGFGEPIVARTECGAALDAVYSDGPYLSAAAEFRL
ncbi:hypothetical protein [Roseospira visakhapatnamensis]|uniref:Uncharacterized protein n=1 Tax=Roseospira visakhapatnamensis TaxID=390880 RepID=A0A7W6RG32_9PROT|nr:hypothetical protein [Roseospira visakhapatnamensis]MBB4267924.1 hypothetical protein [Roseospira visakhapatnamensis]